jgi:hypothetical protein
LKIGYPEKYIWPKIDLNDTPENWFSILFETSVIKHFREGYNLGFRYVNTQIAANARRTRVYATE